MFFIIFTLCHALKNIHTPKQKLFQNNVETTVIVHIANKIERIKMKNKLSKSKFLFIFLVTTALLCSCGTRKTETIKRDSISINNTYSQGEKIVLGNTFTYIPFDSLKPMKIDGKEYVNVIITNDKSKTVTIWKDRNITKTKGSLKLKQTEKSDNTILWIGIAFVIAAGVIAFLKIPSLRL